MPNDTQPVPPIFEPEIAAEVVVAAGFAKRPRREYWVASPTVEAIVAQRIFLGYRRAARFSRATTAL